MASTINASTISTSGLVYNADASGVLQLQSNGVTGLTVGSGGVVTAANGIVMNTMTLGSPVTGKFEYDGRVPYFTPQGTQRGVVPGMQYFVLDGSIAGSNTTGAQNILGVGVTLTANTHYAFEASFNFFKLVGTTSHTFSFGWGGTALPVGITATIIETDSINGFITPTRPANTYVLETANAAVLTGSITSAFYTVNLTVKGIVKTNASGTLIPQYTLSAAPGGVYNTSGRSYMSIWPIGAAPGNVSVGTWA